MNAREIFDTAETLDADDYSAAQLAELDAYARKAIADLARQDSAGETDGQPSVEAWHRSAGQAGDLICCRVIEWADERLGGAQRIYDEARAS
jgi:hypothetical protein